MTESKGFCQAIGQWRGTAEVYDGQGRFLANGVDQRHVRPDEDDDQRVRIDLSFTGPFKFAGHYYIDDRGNDRVYQGPINVGFAESLGDNGVTADNYWASVGLTQRFFLMVLPGGTKQLSLALLDRGDRPVYAVVGENDRVAACATELAAPPAPSFLDGGAHDLGGDPAGGRGGILLQRSGQWTGTLMAVDDARVPLPSADYQEDVSLSEGVIRVRQVGGSFAPEPAETTLRTDGYAAWSHSGNLVGSYSLSGGRAMSGHFHRLREELRVWRREVVAHDGSLKAVVHEWYRGGRRVGTQYGVLEFDPR